MKTKAFIIKNNEIVASVTTDLKNGSIVQYSWKTCVEAINADREKNLVGASFGKISRAQIWFKKDFGESGLGVEINPSEFHIL